LRQQALDEVLSRWNFEQPEPPTIGPIFQCTHDTICDRVSSVSPTAEKKPYWRQDLFNLANQRSGAFEELLSALFLHLLGSLQGGR
jgi:hypothetical protein